MIASVVLTLANLEPSDLPSAHHFQALVEIREISGAVDREHIDLLSFLTEVDKHTIVKSGLMLVIDCVARI